MVPHASLYATNTCTYADTVFVVEFGRHVGSGTRSGQTDRYSHAGLDRCMYSFVFP